MNISSIHDLYVSYVADVNLISDKNYQNDTLQEKWKFNEY